MERTQNIDGSPAATTGRSSVDRSTPFNPHPDLHLLEPISLELVRLPATPLAALDEVRGAGIYAIYYHGVGLPIETGPTSPMELAPPCRAEG